MPLSRLVSLSVCGYSCCSAQMNGRSLRCCKSYMQHPKSHMAIPTVHLHRAKYSLSAVDRYKNSTAPCTGFTNLQVTTITTAICPCWAHTHCAIVAAKTNHVPNDKVHTYFLMLANPPLLQGASAKYCDHMMDARLSVVTAMDPIVRTIGTILKHKQLSADYVCIHRPSNKL